MIQHEKSAARVILASQSPRRRQLLDQIGLPCSVVNVEVDERPLPEEPAHDYVLRLARAKAKAGRAASDLKLAVIGADTCVCVEQKILGKPVDVDDAIAMLSRLSGQTHQVFTGVAVLAARSDAQPLGCVSVTDVRFRALSEHEIQAYCASDEPKDKAGAYAIQGKAAVFVAALSGSYTGVVGLPLFELDELLRQADIDLWNKSQIPPLRE